MAREIVVGAKGVVEPEAVAAASEAFERVSRAVRRGVRLAQFLATAPVARAGRSAEQQVVTNRRRILRSVEDMIGEEVPPGDAEQMHAELLERLDGPDLQDELIDRPLAEVIRMVRADLGITALRGGRSWKRRTPEDVVVLEQRAGLRSPVPQRGIEAGACGGPLLAACLPRDDGEERARPPPRN